MQNENNYNKEVFNGDIGFIEKINPVDQKMVVVFDYQQLNYDFNEVDQLSLSYAVTVHKAQGSEFPVVVIPLITAHYMMLQRNLLYTAITRAKELCVLVGSKKAIAKLNNRDTWAKIDVNDIALWISNVGLFAVNQTGYAGLEYPNGSGKNLVYSAGPWSIGRTSIRAGGSPWPIRTASPTPRAHMPRHTCPGTTTPAGGG